MARQSACVVLSSEERVALEGLCRKSSTPQSLARRARMILLAGDGVGVVETAARLGVWRKTVSGWRRRWLDGSGCGLSVEVRLSDAPRSGAPAKITADQICQIVALACEPPSASGVPVSQWSQQGLAREAVKRGFVDKVSQRSVGRFLKRCRP